MERVLWRASGGSRDAERAAENRNKRGPVAADIMNQRWREKSGGLEMNDDGERQFGHDVCVFNWNVRN